MRVALLLICLGVMPCLGNEEDDDLNIVIPIYRRLVAPPKPPTPSKSTLQYLVNPKAILGKLGSKLLGKSEKGPFPFVWHEQSDLYVKLEVGLIPADQAFSPAASSIHLGSGPDDGTGKRDPAADYDVPDNSEKDMKWRRLRLVSRGFDVWINPAHWEAHRRPTAQTLDANGQLQIPESLRRYRAPELNSPQKHPGITNLFINDGNSVNFFHNEELRFLWVNGRIAYPGLPNGGQALKTQFRVITNALPAKLTEYFDMDGLFGTALAGISDRGQRSQLIDDLVLRKKKSVFIHYNVADRERATVTNNHGDGNGSTHHRRPSESYQNNNPYRGELVISRKPLNELTNRAIQCFFPPLGRSHFLLQIKTFRVLVNGNLAAEITDASVHFEIAARFIYFSQPEATKINAALGAKPLAPTSSKNKTEKDQKKKGQAEPKEKEKNPKNRALFAFDDNEDHFGHRIVFELDDKSFEMNRNHYVMTTPPPPGNDADGEVDSAGPDNYRDNTDRTSSANCELKRKRSFLKATAQAATSSVEKVFAKARPSSTYIPPGPDFTGDTVCTPSSSSPPSLHPRRSRYISAIGAHNGDKAYEEGNIVILGEAFFRRFFVSFGYKIRETDPQNGPIEAGVEKFDMSVCITNKEGEEDSTAFHLMKPGQPSEPSTSNANTRRNTSPPSGKAANKTKVNTSRPVDQTKSLPALPKSNY
ncbi:hypothetical protein H4R33_000275 [Dimargaris cristalligena]|nr:hypothetical protein H4R33_000275 [Dimargaris cristalligena]